MYEAGTGSMTMGTDTVGGAEGAAALDSGCGGAGDSEDGSTLGCGDGAAAASTLALITEALGTTVKRGGPDGFEAFMNEAEGALVKRGFRPEVPGRGSGFVVMRGAGRSDFEGRLLAGSVFSFFSFLAFGAF